MESEDEKYKYQLSSSENPPRYPQSSLDLTNIYIICTTIFFSLALILMCILILFHFFLALLHSKDFIFRKRGPRKPGLLGFLARFFTGRPKKPRKTPLPSKNPHKKNSINSIEVANFYRDLKNSDNSCDNNHGHNETSRNHSGNSLKSTTSAINCLKTSINDGRCIGLDFGNIGIIDNKRNDKIFSTTETTLKKALTPVLSGVGLKVTKQVNFQKPEQSQNSNSVSIIQRKCDQINISYKQQKLAEEEEAQEEELDEVFQKSRFSYKSADTPSIRSNEELADQLNECEDCGDDTDLDYDEDVEHDRMDRDMDDLMDEYIEDDIMDEEEVHDLYFDLGRRREDDDLGCGDV